MTNESIKELLLSLRDCSLDFSVCMTGKESKKVNGLYKPDTHEIFLHNKNFKNDNQLIYTAIHEYTHHLICSNDKKAGLRNAKAHGTDFWALFDELLDIAISNNVYVRTRSDTLSSLIDEAKKLDCEIANLKKKLGKLLVEIQKQSKEEEIRFEDVLSHDIRIKKTTATKCMQSSLLNKSDVGQDLQEILSKTVNKSEEVKQAAAEAVEKGNSVERVQDVIFKKKDYNSPKDKLVKEKNRLERTISALSQRLDIVCEQLESL